MEETVHVLVVLSQCHSERNKHADKAVLHKKRKRYSECEQLFEKSLTKIMTVNTTSTKVLHNFLLRSTHT